MSDDQRANAPLRESLAKPVVWLYRSVMTGTMAGQHQPSRQQPVLLLLVVGLIALACGIALGVAWHTENRDRWQTGRGYVGVHEVSVRSQGWTYGADAAVPWIDVEGA
jgi:hypothetical protein